MLLIASTGLEVTISHPSAITPKGWDAKFALVTCGDGQDDVRGMLG
jgi:hypothetical protein